jgi:FixJ family two-component response regulator
MSEIDMPQNALISIVDDDESVRAAMKGLLKSLGYATETFASAEEFVASPQIHRTACLILDINLPGMSGPELHRQLVASGMAIPTIIITSYPDDRVRASALSAGAIGYLTKPFHKADLLDYVGSALGESN